MGRATCVMIYVHYVSIINKCWSPHVVGINIYPSDYLYLMVFWLSGRACCVMFYYSVRSCVQFPLVYFFPSPNNYVIQKYTLSPEGMFANTRFSQEQCWQTLLFVLRENVCKYLTQTTHIESCRDPEQTADVLTKGLPRPKHIRHITEMGLALTWRGV